MVIDMIKRKEKFNGYQNYIFYKKALERFSQGDCGRREISEYTGIHLNSTLHMIRILKKENVIKIKSFRIDPDGSKRMIYTLVDKLALA